MSTSMEQKIEGKEHFHGSDLEKIEKYFGIPKEKITGFGANVNPLGISPKMKEGLATHLDVLTASPDPEYTELRKLSPLTPDVNQSRYWWEMDVRN